MWATFQRYLVPGLVIQAVIVGATYSTGREVTEFFLKFGPASGLAGLLLATFFYSGVCVVVFELARRYEVTDYKHFCTVYMGPFWFLYEIGFLFGLMLTLSVIAAASSEMMAEMFNAPDMVSVTLMMLAIGILVNINGARLERVMSYWSVFFYLSYLTLVILTLIRFGGQVSDQLAAATLDSSALSSAAIYTAFSCSILPTLVFVTRNLRHAKDAVIAGSLCGPLVILPGLALLLMLTPFYPAVIDEPIPIMLVLQEFERFGLAVIVQVAILGTLAATGAGLLHGLNERIVNTFGERNLRVPTYLRGLVALIAMVFSVVLATRFGIIELVAQGFRYGAIVFVVIILLPLLVRGFYMILPGKGTAATTGNADGSENKGKVDHEG